MSKKDNALNLVDQMLENENKISTKETKRQYEKKQVDGPCEVCVNEDFDPNLKEEYWPGDTIKLSEEMRQRTGLDKDAFVVVSQYATAYKEACVYCPWYSMYGWGASTMAAFKACIDNIAKWREQYPEQAKELLLKFKGYKPSKRPLHTLTQEAEQEKLNNKSATDKTVTDIIGNLI
jgi:hypothetical protein